MSLFAKEGVVVLRVDGFLVIEKVEWADRLIRSDDLIEVVSHDELKLKRTNEALVAP